MSVIKLRKPKDVEYEDIPIQCLMDIEASSLSDESYPIEIAWYRPNHEDNDSFLIKPAETWTDWDPLSEELYHEIPRETLIREGITPYEAATRLNKSLKGMHVVADGYEWDSFWIQKLFNEAGVKFEFYFLPFYDAEHLPEFYRPHRALPDVMATYAAYTEWKKNGRRK